jgi:hypothetical protein
MIVPELAAIVGALAFASLVGVPGLRTALLRRRRELRECLSCRRMLVLGKRTCDCD